MARDVSQWGDKPGELSVTISSGGTTSTSAVLHGCTPVLFLTPASLTGTSFTFQGSIDGGTTFTTMKYSFGTSVSYTVAANGLYILEPADFVGVDAIKIVSGSSEAADRTIKIKAMPI